MKSKHRYLGYIILAVIIITFIALPYLFPGLKRFSSPTYVRDLLLSLGNWSYLMYTALLVASIPLPIPSTPIALGGGYVFGLTVSIVLSLIAGIIGGTISFLLVRKYGRRLLNQLVDEHHIQHFNRVFKKRRLIVAFVSYAIPIFPSDAVSALLGLTRIKYLTFFWLIVVSHIPRFLIINSLGEDLYQGITIKTIIVLVLAAIFILIAVFREKIKQLLFKELRELESKAEVVEEEIGWRKKKKTKSI